MAFTVELSPAGTTFTVEDNEPVLDAALRQNVLLPYGCRNGACGSCRGRVLAGELEHGAGGTRGLSDRELAAGWTLLCQARARSDLVIAAEELDRGKDLHVRTLPVRVSGRQPLAHDVMALYLQLPRTERLQYLAGQYVDIVLRDGRRRAFSLANPPHDDDRLELHVRRVPGGAFSEHVFTDLEARSLLRLRGPLGSFCLRADSPRPLLFVAGGTGFAPIKSILEHALHERLTRPMHLYWGVRARRDLYHADLAAGWAEAHPHVRFTPVLSEPDPSDGWTGRTGFVHDAVLEDYPDLAGHDVYASGPPVMVDAVRSTFPDRGLPLECLFSDAFDYAYETGHDA